ncbi:MAG: hypothetical protein ABIC57_01380 [bacterium]
MLKHFPHEFDKEMLTNQDKFLQQLKQGKAIHIFSGEIKMYNGKIHLKSSEE